MSQRIGEQRSPGFWPLATVFALFVLFLYGPMITIFVLSFQGPEGGLTFPLRGVSLHWFYKLAEGLGTVDIGAAFRRSLALGAVVMAFTVVLSVLAGLAFRKKLAGGNALFFVTVASLIMPSIIVSLGIGLQFRLIDTRHQERADGDGRDHAARRLRHRAGPVQLGTRRAPDLDAALRPAHHVRGVQPLQPGLRGSRARPRRHAVADLPLRGAAADRPVDRGHRHVRLHAVAGTRSPAPRRPSATSTRCRSSCRA